MCNLLWLYLIWRIKSLIPYFIKVFVGHVEIVTSLLELSVVPSCKCLRRTIFSIFNYGPFLHDASLRTLFLVTSLSPVALFVFGMTLIRIIAHYSL